MARSIPLLIVGWVCGFIAPNQVVQPSTIPPRSVKPAPMVSAPDRPAEPQISVSEAIRSANEVLDRLEARDEVDPADPLLEQVEHFIEIVETKEPTHSWLAYLRGRVLALVGRSGDASVQLLDFVETREGRTEWRAYRLLGDLFVGEFPRLARANYEKAAALNAGETSVLFGLSVCAMKLGATREAIALTRDIVAADGRRTIRYVSHLASLLESTKQWDEALREADHALTLALQDMRDKPAAREPLLVVDAQYRLLNSILRARIAEPGRTAVDDYLRLAKRVREHVRIMEKLSLHEVLHIVQAGVEKTAPNTPPSLLQAYGIILTEVGRTADAITVFEKLLQVDPGHSAAMESLSRLRPESTDAKPIENP